jgi:lysophospholipase L1-like esterase
MKKAIGGIVALLLLAGGIASYYFWSMGKPDSWESSIRKFEESDRVHPPKPGTIVFTGSSSINYWNTLAEDMRPLDVVNRGFGGSQIAQVNQYARRVVIPYRPRAVVLYAGENDLSWPWSKSAETVVEDFRQFVQLIHAELPDAWIYYVSMKPSPLRWGNWPTIHRANLMIESFIRTQQRVQYIDVSAAMLDAQGQPRRELFRSDGLHMNPQGYALWISIIKPALLSRFGDQSR